MQKHAELIKKQRPGKYPRRSPIGRLCPPLLTSGEQCPKSPGQSIPQLLLLTHFIAWLSLLSGIFSSCWPQILAV